MILYWIYRKDPDWRFIAAANPSSRSACQSKIIQRQPGWVALWLSQQTKQGLAWQPEVVGRLSKNKVQSGFTSSCISILLTIKSPEGIPGSFTLALLKTWRGRRSHLVLSEQSCSGPSVYIVHTYPLVEILSFPPFSVSYSARFGITLFRLK